MTNMLTKKLNYSVRNKNPMSPVILDESRWNDTNLEHARINKNRWGKEYLMTTQTDKEEQKSKRNIYKYHNKPHHTKSEKVTISPEESKVNYTKGNSI